MFQKYPLLTTLILSLVDNKRGETEGVNPFRVTSEMPETLEMCQIFVLFSQICKFFS